MGILFVRPGNISKRPGKDTLYLEVSVNASLRLALPDKAGFFQSVYILNTTKTDDRPAIWRSILSIGLKQTTALIQAQCLAMMPKKPFTLNSSVERVIAR